MWSGHLWRSHNRRESDIRAGQQGRNDDDEFLARRLRGQAESHGSSEPSNRGFETSTQPRAAVKLGHRKNTALGQKVTHETSRNWKSHRRDQSGPSRLTEQVSLGLCGVGNHTTARQTLTTFLIWQNPRPTNPNPNPNPNPPSIPPWLILFVLFTQGTRGWCRHCGGLRQSYLFRESGAIPARPVRYGKFSHGGGTPHVQ